MYLSKAGISFLAIAHCAPTSRMSPENSDHSEIVLKKNSR